jgi:hypothetical protein
MLFCTQEGGSNTPIFYNGTDWLSCVFPTPAGTPIFALADGGTGVVDAGEHYWRIRFRYSNGASLACAGIAHTADGSKTMLLSGITPSTRSDYLGFSVERTIVGEPGLWYVVGDSAAKTDTGYTDNTADADLGDLVPAEPGVFGSAPHFDGVIAHADLLFGWTESNLYVSDAIGADYGCGCLNFHPYYYQVKADDGDPIKLAVQQLDRLVVVKGASMHAFTGFDRDSFACTQIHGSIGTPSTRGAAADGSRVFIYGGRSRIFVLDGQTVRGLGNPQITHYLDKIALTGENMVEVVNYRGDYILFAYPSASSSTNDEVLAFSMLGRNWEHYTGIRICGSLCPKNDTEFGGATMVYGDPKYFDPEVVEEGGGGIAELTAYPFYLAWLDDRLKTAQYRQVFAQRVDASGAPSWSEDGIQASNFSTDAGEAAICPASPTGCIVASVGSSGSAAYVVVVNRYSLSGELQWTADANTGSYYRKSPAIIAYPDGSIIVLWERGTGYLVQGQRFSADGTLLWAAAGKDILATNLYDSVLPSFSACTDGAGGFWLAWSDRTSYQVRMARFDSTGTQVGATVYANNNARAQRPLSIMPDGAGGLWVSWYDAGAYQYVCRYDSSGAPLFSVAQVNSATPQSYTAAPMTSDGAGGVFSWLEWPYTIGYMKARGVSSDGTLSAVVSVGDYSNGTQPRIVRDSTGGYIVAWTRREIAGDNVYRVLVQRFTAAGENVWSSPVSVDSQDAADGIRFYLEDLIPDGDDGCYVVYTCMNPSISTTRNVKANRVYADGALWADTGLVVCDAANAQVSPLAALEGTQYGDLPAPVTAGYRVWSLFEGETDEAAFDGSGGTPIPIMFETPEYDAGEPDTMKSFDRLQLYTKQGKATFAARLTTELGAANVSFAVEQSGSTWVGGTREATTLIWNQGKWAGTKPGEATVGIPPGTLGKRCKLAVWANASEKIVLVGHALDFQLLPERPYV